MSAPDRKRRLTAFAVAIAVLIATPLAVVAADAFEDVPDSNVHHDDITWLSDNGVTAGCNPPDNTEFCPGDPVLRQQMASFMRRLAENQVVDAATAIEAQTAASADNADMLDGEAATAYETLVSYFDCGFANATSTDCSTAEISNTEGTLIGEASLSAPAAGISELRGSVGAQTTDTSQFWVWITTDTSCDATSGTTATAQAINGKLAVTSAQGAVETLHVAAIDAVSAGDETYRLCAFAFGSPAEQPLFTADLYIRWTQAPTSAILSSDDATDHGDAGLGG